MATSITLKWTDFVQISNLKYDKKINQGVYFWGFTINGNFVPYYIGVAAHLVYRIFEHINFTYGGRYTIFHKDSLHEFTMYKKDMVVNEEMNRGVIYIPDWPSGYKAFLEKRDKLRCHIDFILETFTISFAYEGLQELSMKQLQEIEKICINQIGKEKLINSRSGYSDEFMVTHKGNEIIKRVFANFGY
jgi:hypothetical protein